MYTDLFKLIAEKEIVHFERVVREQCCGVDMLRVNFSKQLIVSLY